jgi:hypothetical protein
MAHDASKVKLGVVGSSDRLITIHASDPADTPAGFAVSLASDYTLAKTGSSGGASGMRIGVSLGKSLSDEGLWTAVCRAGLRVPVRLANYATAKVTITSYANLIDDTDDTLTIGATTFTAQSGAATEGQATFQAASSNDATATSLALQINEHAVASTKVVATAVAAVVYLVAVDAGADGEIEIVYDDVDGTGDSVGLTVTGSTLGTGGAEDTLALFSPVQGANVYFDSVSGEACSPLSGNAIVSDAIYIENGALTGIDEAGAEVRACMIDMGGGL